MSEESQKKEFLFGKRNFKFLLFSLALIATGFFIMSGGGSEDPNEFNNEIFSFTRIRLAPTVVLLGFGVAIYAILTSQKKNK